MLSAHSFGLWQHQLQAEADGLTERLGESGRRELLDRIKHLEYRGYDFETAEGTFELLVREVASPSFHPFDVVSYEVNTKLVAGDETVTTASVVLKMLWRFAFGDGAAYKVRCTHWMSACGNAWLQGSLIADVRLVDYKVRVLGVKGGTESKVRVLVEWSDHKRSWATICDDFDKVIDVIWNAAVDA